jgi:glycosyltransferase involved in cell wall biosynthesis
MKSKYIFIACPWNPNGGGMFKVADYLIQCQDTSHVGTHTQATLRPLDTRGDGSAVASLGILLLALVRVMWGRLTGRLAGVHVNMAERLSLFRKAVVVAFCRAIGLPVVLHLHAAQLHHFYAGLAAPLRWLVRWSFSRATRVVVLGAAAQKFVVDDLRVPQERVTIVINGVPQPIARRIAEAEPNRSRRLLFLGNLSERKGVSDLIAALGISRVAKSMPFEAIFAGKGDIPGYQAKAKAAGVDSMVQFVGWADQKMAATLMASADVLVLPSYDEGLPLVILEALANSTAVICTPVGEIPHALADGVEALFVPPGDVSALANAIDTVLEQPALRQQLQANGRALYEREFSLEKFADSIAAIHRECFGVASRADTETSVKLPNA